MKKFLNSLLLIGLLTCHLAYGQMSEYAYKRELLGISGTWHKIPLPNEIFGKINAYKSDIRIFGVTAEGDTMQVPYLFKSNMGTSAYQPLVFKSLNTSKQGDVHYFTFEIPSEEALNRINLAFENSNFDWRLTLEGSQNMSEWFTILENYRILSLKNETTDYQFTQILFPDSKYRYFRVGIKSAEKPKLQSASVFNHKIVAPIYRNYAVQNVQIQQLKESKQTEITFSLANPVPVDYVAVGVKSSVDYYRPLTIQYVYDSLKMESGPKAQYRTIGSARLTSMEENAFNCQEVTAQHFRLLINNHDNEPLAIDSVVVKGYEQAMWARFVVPASYYLVYGNQQAVRPQYDIETFAQELPDTLKVLSLGEEMRGDAVPVAKTKPLFENPIWLWTIIGVVIVLLGWFSVKMLDKKPSE